MENGMTHDEFEASYDFVKQLEVYNKLLELNVSNFSYQITVNSLKAINNNLKNKNMEDEFVKIKDLKQGDVIEVLFGFKRVLEVKKDTEDFKSNWITVFFTDGSKYHCIEDELIIPCVGF